METNQHPSDIGVIGMGIMGTNLTLNFLEKDYRISIYNRTTSKAERLIEENNNKKDSLRLAKTLEELMEQLATPRIIIVMVSAGEALKAILEQLLPLLSPGDIVMDGGNSYFSNTEEWMKTFEEKGILFVGCGISGGALGARNGPSLMPSGSDEARIRLQDVLSSIAARDQDGNACCRWIGKGGSGHYVKMVHNGIEYAEMQILCEAYDILRRGFGLDCNSIADLFSSWQTSSWSGFLLEAFFRVLRHPGEMNECIVDDIIDSASQKGTGIWTAKSSLELNVPATILYEATAARTLSSLLDLRKTCREHRLEISSATRSFSTNDANCLEQAIHASKILSMGQGFLLIVLASERHNWGVIPGDVAGVWRNGCIIRSKMLKTMQEVWGDDPKASLFVPHFLDQVNSCVHGWRRTISTGISLGIPMPGMCSALAFYDGLMSEVLPANILQGVRDFFGSHGYARIGHPIDEKYHTDWTPSG